MKSRREPFPYAELRALGFEAVPAHAYVTDGGRLRPEFPLEHAVALYTKHRLSVAIIAKRLGYSPVAVYTQLRGAGVKFRPQRYGPRWGTTRRERNHNDQDHRPPVQGNR